MKKVKLNFYFVIFSCFSITASSFPESVFQFTGEIKCVIGTLMILTRGGKKTDLIRVRNPLEARIGPVMFGVDKDENIYVWDADDTFEYIKKFSKKDGFVCQIRKNNITNITIYNNNIWLLTGDSLKGYSINCDTVLFSHYLQENKSFARKVRLSSYFVDKFLLLGQFSQKNKYRISRIFNLLEGKISKEIQPTENILPLTNCKDYDPIAIEKAFFTIPNFFLGQSINYLVFGRSEKVGKKKYYYKKPEHFVFSKEKKEIKKLNNFSIIYDTQPNPEFVFISDTAFVCQMTHGDVSKNEVIYRKITFEKW